MRRGRCPGIARPPCDRLAADPARRRTARQCGAAIGEWGQTPRLDAPIGTPMIEARGRPRCTESGRTIDTAEEAHDPAVVLSSQATRGRPERFVGEAMVVSPP